MQVQMKHDEMVVVVRDDILLCPWHKHKYTEYITLARTPLQGEKNEPLAGVHFEW
jgi:hypothetical protein